jgi:NAD(P)-dependent dehydrogenase (short-subunit alcohol dehydrogenase family)
VELGVRGKAVVVTGGSKGIGLACAQAFLDEGARVRINAINPGATMTARVQEALRLEAKARGLTEQEVLAQGQAKVPMRRYAAAEDVAHLALFLASDKAGYITGAIVPMDGGSNPVL